MNDGNLYYRPGGAQETFRKNTAAVEGEDRTDWGTGDDTNSLPTNTRGSANIDLMLVQRLRRRPALGQH